MARKIETLENTVRSFLHERNIPSLVEINVAKDKITGMKELVKMYGIGPLAPNTFLLGETEKIENFIPFAELIQVMYRAGRNIVIIREGHKRDKSV